MTNEEVKFGDLTFEQKVEAVEARLGNQPGRIKTPHDLQKLHGQEVFMVLSPHGKDNNISNCFFDTWKVGKVMDHRGNEIQQDVPLSFDNDLKYVCSHYDEPKHIISLKDFNVVPNNYNNHAIFSSKEDADAYSLYRKMCFGDDESIAELDGSYAPFFTEDDMKNLCEAEDKARSETNTESE